MTAAYDDALEPDEWELLARRFEPKPPPKWRSPGVMAQALDSTTKQTAALRLIDEHLVMLEAGTLPQGDGSHLMIFMAPQEGKSERCSRRYPAWAMDHDPSLRFGIVSYSDDKADRWGRVLRRDVTDHPELNIDIRRDSRAAGRWETTKGGGVICAGIGGGITGEPLDRLVIDDPVRGRAEAESATYRETAWDIWESNLSTRASERFRALLMTTRWHEDDLAGRLMTREPGVWHVLSIPAIADSPNDPLGRYIGEELPSARGREPGYFRNLEKLRSPYVFSSIYQQRPVPAVNSMLPRASWKFWALTLDEHGRETVNADVAWPLEHCYRFITVDLAVSTKTSADFTVVSAWAITPSGHLILLDRFRDRVPQGGHTRPVVSLRSRWKVGTVFIESRMFGTTLVYEMGRAGVPIEELEADVDKVTRAVPAANRLQAGEVWLPAGRPWLDEWIDEAAGFPNWAYDDQVDTLSYAARVRGAHWLQAAQQQRQPEVARRTPLELSDSVTAAPGLDLARLNYE